MTIGYLFKQYEDDFKWLDSSKSMFILLPIYIVEVSIYYYFNGHSVSFKPSPCIIDGIVVSITGILLCIAVSKQIRYFDSLLIFIGSNYLLYFCLHGKVYNILQKIYHILIPGINSHSSQEFGGPFALGILITMLTALIVIVPVLIINKFFPWSIGRGFSFVRKSSKSSESKLIQFS